MIPQSRTNNNPWANDDDPLWLLTMEEFDSLPDGTVVESINHAFKTKGRDYIDQDTRFGIIAWGFRESVVAPELPQERII